MNTTPCRVPEEYWPDSDEQSLLELQDRKQRVMGQKRGEVEKIIGGFFYYGIREEDVVDELIKNAEPLMYALRPFTKLVIE